MYLKGFNFIGYLKKHFMLGQVDPWRMTEKGDPIYTLLVSTDIAYEECKNWSNQEFSRKEFTNYLKLNDIYLFHNIDEFKKIKEDREKGIKTEVTPKKKKRELTPERLEKLRKQAELMNKMKKDSIS